jgi:hypothetical protein
MITEEEIAQARERERLLAKSYREGLTDFVKWTSTLAIAATLWVGNASVSAKASPRPILVVSLAFLIVSLILAVVAVRDVLLAWEREWASASALNSFYLVKKLRGLDPPKASQENEDEAINRLLESWSAEKPFSHPKRFNVWLAIHMILLLLGLAAYAVAQLLGSS